MADYRLMVASADQIPRESRIFRASWAMLKKYALIDERAPASLLIDQIPRDIERLANEQAGKDPVIEELGKDIALAVWKYIEKKYRRSLERRDAHESDSSCQ